ncbi:ABC transporter ATP-binding protein [Pseudoxanthomonas suwonensis]|uniref:Phosphate ABC transporter ATPase n=1 Tax=Pseudoxanthomonas suwonensis TaxID=314722 RepID=A0A0E3Z490_9GAMM|nr:ABC transporter ATP-binding protein [Pseudoxanthomonas suwonensis]AKC87217.1 phosphate ABC transporter ATPase [Pseudoxanthomonas suwonensis]
MCSEDSVVHVDHVSKSYMMFDTPRSRLKQFIVPRLQGMLGMRRSRYYEEFHALSDISFSVGRGETVGIIGRNGSGKSTLLQIICGTLTASSGAIATKGRIAALLELGSGFNPDFTGRENVRLNAALLGLSQREIDRRFDDIVRFADIGDFLDQPIKTYSSGMVVRLAFATAIHVDPDLLIVDEALAVGDVAFQQKCLDRIRQMQRNGVSILLVTHSTNVLLEYCDRAIFLKRGGLILDGACRDVVQAYADDLVKDEGGEIVVVHIDPPYDEIPAAAVAPEADVAAPDLDVAIARDVSIFAESVALLDAHGNPCSMVEYGGEVRAKVRVRVNERVAEPCFGVQISSVDGIALWSATTQGMGIAQSPLEPGCYEMEWKLRTPFSGNRYVLAIGVGQIVNGEYRRTHRVSYAGHFDVMVQPHTGTGWLAPAPAFREPALVVSQG